MTNDDYRRGYSKGYFSGSRTAWPLYHPPRPPDPIIAELVTALINLRDTADLICAMFDEDDDVFNKFDEPINQATEALSKLGEWVKTPEERTTRI